jgi:hypothetical protein
LSSSGPRFGDLTDRLEKMPGYFRDTDESSHSTSTTDDKVTARPPRAAATDIRRSVGLPSGRFMDIPSSSKSSSRSNISPFGRTPPSSSPNVSSYLESWGFVRIRTYLADPDPDKQGFGSAFIIRMRIQIRVQSLRQMRIRIQILILKVPVKESHVFCFA